MRRIGWCRDRESKINEYGRSANQLPPEDTATPGRDSNFGDLCPGSNKCKIPALNPALTTHVCGKRVMIGIAFIGVVTVLAVFAILAKTCAGGPKKVDKREKGEIIKQLLALSDRENSNSAIASPPARSRSGSTSAIQSDTLRKGTSRKPNSHSPVSSKPPTSLKTKRSDTEIEEKTRQRA
jgi:hypothetical protein